MFTNEPLPDIACHGPLLPMLPEDCHVEVDVTPGCHKGSELFRVYNGEIAPYNNESAIAFHQVVDFLEQGGLQFDFTQLNLSYRLQDRSTQNKINLLKEIEVRPTLRSMHFDNEIKASEFNPNDKASIFINLYHQKLAGKNKNLSECALVLKDYNPKPTFSNCLKSIGIFKTATLAGGALASYAAYSYFS
ncbi:MAG: hypothetical protein H0U75_00500 [Legionella sp.]|nr:hypothetical protein [Legionella sp.]